MARSRLGPLAIEAPLGRKTSSQGHTVPDGQVWRAIHVAQRKSVAVRIFSVTFGGTVESRQQFADEWERLKQIDHPAIAKCYGGGFEHADAYLVHELIEGPTLADEIERRGRLPWESVLDIAEPIADALRLLHSLNIVHGRIEPDKVIMAGFSPVIVDVRNVDGSAPFRGGPYFLSRPPTITQMMRRAPESPGPQDAITVRADLYCFGALMYEALTGSPPITGSTIQEVRSNLQFQTPISVAATVMECPVWIDRLVMQLLSKDLHQRPVSADALLLQLAEARRRSMSRAGVAEHASAGFSPLNVTDSSARAEARALLGREPANAPEKPSRQEAGVWHDQSWFLLPALFLLLGMLAWVAWPMSEETMRKRAEALMAEETRSSMSQARISYLEPMLHRFPSGEHVEWAKEQIDRVEMLEAEHALTVKINRNLPLQNEAERLCAEAIRLEKFGDTASAIDKYQSLVTLLADDEQYRPLVNLARSKVARIQSTSTGVSEAARIITDRLAEADEMFASGQVVAARQIWYSIVELYAGNSAVAPLVQIAQDKLGETK